MPDNIPGSLPEPPRDPELRAFLRVAVRASREGWMRALAAVVVAEHHGMTAAERAWVDSLDPLTARPPHNMRGAGRKPLAYGVLAEDLAAGAITDSDLVEMADHPRSKTTALAVRYKGRFSAQVLATAAKAILKTRAQN